MSVALDCPSCALGSHENHDPDHGIKPGLIGGVYCACTGDCPQRFERDRQRIIAVFSDCVPAGCRCSCHRFPGAVSHVAACCSSVGAVVGQEEHSE